MPIFKIAEANGYMPIMGAGPFSAIAFPTAPHLPAADTVEDRRAVPRDPADREAFKAAMRHLVGAVSIVTVSAGDQLNGLTATSVTSLSADPPSLIVCIKRDVSGIPLLRESGRFGVSILGEGHQFIADRFAGRDGRRGADRYHGADWVSAPEAPPVLADALASFDCVVEDMIDRFSHTIVIGRVTGSRARGGDGALVYWRAAYGRLA